MTELRRPSPDLYDAWLDCVRDFGDGPLDGSGDWQVPGFAPDRRTFDALREVVAVEADVSRELPEGHVHADHYWVFDGEQMVGFITVRHHLGTEFLRTAGGHIGYSIRPARRREGHASAALRLALGRAAELGLDRVLVTCDLDNVASARTIERCGGVFEGVGADKRRYWIDVAA